MDCPSDKEFNEMRQPLSRAVTAGIGPRGFRPGDDTKEMVFLLKQPRSFVEATDDLPAFGLA
jgi:hypothetical protein